MEPFESRRNTERKGRRIRDGPDTGAPAAVRGAAWSMDVPAPALPPLGPVAAAPGWDEDAPAAAAPW